MAGRWQDFGQYGARGVPGWVALGREMDRQVTGFATPVESERGLAARLRYLTESPAGYAAMDRAGIDVNQRTFLAWLAQEQTPNKQNLRRIDEAYWDLRRRNLGVEWKHRLQERGTRIEIHPVDQSQVQREQPGRVRDVPVRRVTVRGHQIWDDIVDAWISEDAEILDVVWDEIITDIGSDYDAYSYVSSVGFGI
jgi:hypothetical protein